jgi:hypothetical protein
MRSLEKIRALPNSKNGKKGFNGAKKLKKDLLPGTL